MIQNFEYLTVFTSAPGALPEQNDRHQIQPWKVNEIKAYKNIQDMRLRKQFVENAKDIKPLIGNEENHSHMVVNNL